MTPRELHMTAGRPAMRWFLSAAILFGLILLFHLQGNTAETGRFGRSVLRWMVMRWTDSTLSAGDYSHGWLIPIVSAVALWHRRKELAAAPKRVFRAGLWVVVAALFLHWIGARAQQPRLSLLSLILLLWSIPLYLAGPATARWLVFPCFYLVLCIPLNFLDAISLPMRIFSTIVSVFVLNGMGIGVERAGSAIYSVGSERFALEVADPCSGIHSLLALVALTVAYAHFTQSGAARKLALGLSCVPLAIVSNIVRIVAVTMVANGMGQATALHFFHDYSGYVLFATAVLLMVQIGRLLERGVSKRPSRTSPPTGSAAGS